MARHKKEQQNYSVSQGQFAKSSEQHPWKAAGTVARVPSVLGHGRARGVGETKEERKGVPFDGLPTTGTHHGSRTQSRKGRRRLCSARRPDGGGTCRVWRNPVRWRRHQGTRGRGAELEGATAGGVQGHGYAGHHAARGSRGGEDAAACSAARGRGGAMEQWERGIISWSSRAGDAREVAGALASGFIGSTRSGRA